MAELWDLFCEKLRGAGYTLKDMEYCNDDLFLTIAEELGAFSPLQISSLLSHWHRLKRAGTLSVSALVSSSPERKNVVVRAKAAEVKAAPAYPAASVRQAAQRLLQRVAPDTAAGATATPLVAQDVIGIEAPMSSWLAFRACVAQQQQQQQQPSGKPNAGEPISLLWKLCSPATLAKIERACASSSSLNFSCDDDMDALCESGIVLFDGSLATTLGSNAVTPALVRQRLADEGWALVAFDVAAGRTRSVSVEEVGNLSHFSMAQCAEMLREAGYHSLSVTSAGAIVLCDATQLVPRNVVYAGVAQSNGMSALSSAVNHNSNARRLDYSAAVDGGDGDAHPDTAGGPKNDLPQPQQPPRHRPLALAERPAQDSQQEVSRATINTTTTTIAAATAAPVTKCEVHPQKEVEFWSSKEKRLLCSHCLYYDGYSRENCVPIEVAAREEMPRLERWVGNATTFTKEVQGVVQLFRDATADIARQEEKVSKDVAQQFAHLRERLSALEADMLHEVHDQSRARRQDVEAAMNDVADTVGRVGALLGEVESPMKLYRASGSAAGLVTCVQLLRGVQRAFADWPAVDIAPYSVSKPLDSFLGETEAALSRVAKVSLMPGKVELPEAIDVNFLRADAE